MKDLFTKQWIIRNSIEVCSQYEPGVLTLRSLHYQLVGLGMTNDDRHYKRVVNAMETARWAGDIAFETFSDLDRVMIGETASKEIIYEDKVDEAKRQVGLWMRSYTRNKWENQPYYPEIFIEKKALQGVFQKVCASWDIALGACKGYPSLTFQSKAAERFKDAEVAGKKPIIIYFGDYDPSGEDIPRSIQDTLLRFGVEVEMRRIALMEHQVLAWKLPPAPAKATDSRTAQWEGLGQVELDAVRPEKLMQLLEKAIEDIFDHDLYTELLETEKEERDRFRIELKSHVNSLKD